MVFLQSEASKCVVSLAFIDEENICFQQGLFPPYLKHVTLVNHKLFPVTELSHDLARKSSLNLAVSHKYVDLRQQK